MKQRGRFAVLSILFLAQARCDLSAYDFGGARVELNITPLSTTKPTPAGRHVELWARDNKNQIVRIQDAHNPGTAFLIVPAVDLGDPCAYDPSPNGGDPNGYLVWSPNAQIEPGLSDEQKHFRAEAVRLRIKQLTVSDITGQMMLAFVSYQDDAPRPTIPPVMGDPYFAMCSPVCPAQPCNPEVDDAPCAKCRLCACQAYWRKSPLYAYTGNPNQLTAPYHGILYGTLDFQSLHPSIVAGGIQITTNYGLRSINELWLTETTASVAKLKVDVIDCVGSPDTCRGNVILQGSAGTLGRGVTFFDMTSPSGTVKAGQASIYSSLDQDPVQF